VGFTATAAAFFAAAIAAHAAAPAAAAASAAAATAAAATAAATWGMERQGNQRRVSRRSTREVRLRRSRTMIFAIAKHADQLVNRKKDLVAHKKTGGQNRFDYCCLFHSVA
jgi:hypothetical protein